MSMRVKISEGILTFSVDESSLPAFRDLINRGLNCWDEAPGEMKELGDMLTHGRIVQKYPAEIKSATRVIPQVFPQTELSLVPMELLPVCGLCAGKGYNHIFNCPNMKNAAAPIEPPSFA